MLTRGNALWDLPKSGLENVIFVVLWRNCIVVTWSCRRRAEDVRTARVLQAILILPLMYHRKQGSCLLPGTALLSCVSLCADADAECLSPCLAEGVRK